MRTATLVALLAVFGSAGTARAADPCDQPRPKDIGPLMKAVPEDEAMAAQFEATATACAQLSAACDAEQAKCQAQLTQVLQRQVNLDDGIYLRDMLLPFLGQKYAITAGIPTATIANDVSCNVDSASLKAAATRRKQLAQKRRDIMNEYPRWAQWAGGLSQKCRGDAALAKSQQDQAAAAAAATAAAAAAAAMTETQKQEAARLAAEQAKQKAEAQAKAQSDALKAQQDAQKRQQEAQAETLRKQQEAQKRAAEDAAMAKMTAEERARAEAQRKEEDRLVAEREANKAAAEKKADELEAQEKARRAAADKQLAAASEIDRSDERLKGSIGAQLSSYWVQAGNGGSGGLLLGGVITGRYGFWMVAPAHGMASGLEIKANVSFHGQIVGTGTTTLFSVLPEIRYFVSHFGFGASFEYRSVSTSLTTLAPVPMALGLTLSWAFFDSPNGRLVATVRWMPLLSNDLSRFTGELEMAYQWFTASLQAGTLVVPGTTGTGWYVGGGLGARLRF